MHFKNNTPFPASVHPQGVFYGKNSEGAPYEDGTAGADKADDAIPKDVDREFVTMFEVSDENRSPWLDENVRDAALEPTPELLSDAKFVEGNLVHGITATSGGTSPASR